MTSRRGGRRGRRTVIDVELKPGALTKYGYNVRDRTPVRHQALKRGARQEGYLPLIQRLSLEATFLKNSSPRLSKVFKSDQRWLSEEYEDWKERTGERESRRSSRRGGRRRSEMFASPSGRGMQGGSLAMRRTIDRDDENRSSDDDEDAEEEDEEDEMENESSDGGDLSEGSFDDEEEDEEEEDE